MLVHYQAKHRNTKIASFSLKCPITAFPEYHLTDYFLSNTSAKNYQNRLMFVEVIASQSSVVF